MLCKDLIRPMSWSLHMCKGSVFQLLDSLLLMMMTAIHPIDYCGPLHQICHPGILVKIEIMSYSRQEHRFIFFLIILWLAGLQVVRNQPQNNVKCFLFILFMVQVVKNGFALGFSKLGLRESCIYFTVNISMSCLISELKISGGIQSGGTAIIIPFYWVFHCSQWEAPDIVLPLKQLWGVHQISCVSWSLFEEFLSCVCQKTLQQALTYPKPTLVIFKETSKTCFSK